ncbi:MAG: hypothetical protein ACJAZM_002844 [Cyclobacteriaceae bacterium]|jgi:hypothetical protein
MAQVNETPVTQPLDSTSASISSKETKVKKPRDWKPSMIRIGYDLANQANSLVNPDRSGFQGIAEVDFDRFFVVGSFGQATIRRGENYNYQSQGSFWRVGIDKNLTTALTDRSVYSFGFRYARSRFDESIDMLDGSSVVSNSALTASWVEITTGLRVRVWKELFMGYQIRLRTLKRLSDELGPLQTYDIPGFGQNKSSGNTVRNAAVGFNYYVYWTIPFRDKTPLPKSK